MLDSNPESGSRRKLDSFDLLEFFRDEIKHEFNLLGQRMGWYVNCQSFLITAFAISLGARFKGPPWFSYTITLIGVATSALVYPAITGAHKTIDMYLRKKRELFRGDPELNELQIARDEFEVNADGVHKQSLAFSWLVPVMMAVFWMGMALLLWFFPGVPG